MNFSRVLSLAVLGLALVVSVALKLSDVSGLNRALIVKSKQAVAALLVREGFDIEVEDRFGFLIHARRDDCRLLIREAAMEGFNVDAITASVPPGARLVFEYDGKLWPAHPTLRAVMSKVWSRLKWHFRLDNTWSPVISIAATGACALDTLHWNELARLQAG